MLFKIHMCYHNSENIWNKEFFCDILFYKSEFEYRKSGQSYKTDRLKCEYEIVIFSNVL